MIRAAILALFTALLAATSPGQSAGIFWTLDPNSGTSTIEAVVSPGEVYLVRDLLAGVAVIFDGTSRSTHGPIPIPALARGYEVYRQIPSLPGTFEYRGRIPLPAGRIACPGTGAVQSAYFGNPSSQDDRIFNGRAVCGSVEVIQQLSGSGGAIIRGSRMSQGPAVIAVSANRTAAAISLGSGVLGLDPSSMLGFSVTVDPTGSVSIPVPVIAGATYWVQFGQLDASGGLHLSNTAAIRG